jgi:hypothetical protein
LKKKLKQKKLKKKEEEVNFGGKKSKKNIRQKKKKKGECKKNKRLRGESYSAFPTRFRVFLILIYISITNEICAAIM